MAHQRTRQLYFQSRAVFDPTDASINFSAVLAHKDAVQSVRYAQHTEELKSVPSLRLLKGVANLIDAHTLAIAGATGPLHLITKHIIIASGAEIILPSFPGVELCLTSHDLYKPSFALAVLPSRLAIIGGGYIGLETASCFAAFGSRVTILQRGKVLLKGMDTEMVNTLIPLLQTSIDIILEVDITRIEKRLQFFRVYYTVGGETRVLEVDQVVVAIGRKPVFPQGL